MLPYELLKPTHPTWLIPQRRVEGPHKEQTVENQAVTFVVDGREVTAPAGSSIIEALWLSGHTLVESVGCLGQGVCGSCKAMVRRADSSEVFLALACEVSAESGMQVSFVHAMAPHREHTYQMEHFTDL